MVQLTGRQGCGALQKHPRVHIARHLAALAMPGNVIERVQQRAIVIPMAVRKWRMASTSASETPRFLQFLRDGPSGPASNSTYGAGYRRNRVRTRAPAESTRRH